MNKTQLLAEIAAFYTDVGCYFLSVHFGTLKIPASSKIVSSTPIFDE